MAKQKEKLISVKTVGCRLNQYESEKMAAQLYPYGFRRAERGEKADIYLINTCTVTHRADADCRNLIRRAARQNPDSRIIVSGCYVENDPELITGMKGVDLIIHNNEKDEFGSIVPKQLPELFLSEPDKNCSTMVTDFYDRNRAWMKISDGCNQWCSFCIIPSVRGRINNLPARQLVDEINIFVEHGYNEIVLTGVHIGHYKNSKSEPQLKNLAALCQFIMNETDLYRMRISSIEPQTVREDFVRTYAESNGRICRHLHLPMQAGASRILKLMQRPYDQKTYIKRLTAIKNAVPETIIGADVIVGFPGETEEDFQRSVRVAESGLLDYLHVFSYSDRPGTRASELLDKVNPTVIKERNAKLSRISQKLRAASFKRQINQTLEVISEHSPDEEGNFFGIADNYVRVKLPLDAVPDKSIKKLFITDAFNDHVVGNLIS